MRGRLRFAIIGAMKCGTTALWGMLKEHPEVFMPTAKEPQFFIADWRGYTIASLWFYNRLFREARPDQVAGEATASYLFYPYAMRMLRLYDPRLRIIIMLRDPAARAYSHWNMNVQKGRESRAFSEALDDELTKGTGLFVRRHHFSYVGRSRYGPQVARALRLFPKEQALILNADQVRGDPEEMWRRVCDHLEIDRLSAPERSLRHQRDYAEPLAPADRARVIEAVRSDIEALKPMVDWDVGPWLTPTPSASAGDRRPPP